MIEPQIDKKTIQILLSTYNGEKYLREQLDSFINQKNINLRVLIRDDGSEDGTVEILREYQEKFGFEVVYGKNIGVNSSIYELLKLADKSVDYFAISDQDDYWHDEKLFAGVQKLELLDNSIPLLYGSRISITDELLNHIFYSDELRRNVSLYNAMTQNVLPGHTQIFNNTLRELVLTAPIDDVIVIDWWLYLIAAGTGTVIYDERAFAKHRQHGNNAIGYQRHGIRTMVNRIKRLRRGQANAISKQIHSFYLCFFRLIKEEYKKELMLYLGSLSSFPKRLRYIINAKAYRQTPFETFLYKFLYLIGKYKL